MTQVAGPIKPAHDNQDCRNQYPDGPKKYQERTEQMTKRCPFRSLRAHAEIVDRVHGRGEEPPDMRQENDDRGEKRQQHMQDLDP